MFTSCCLCCRTASKSISSTSIPTSTLTLHSALGGNGTGGIESDVSIIVPNVESAPEITFDVMDEKEMPSWNSTEQYVPNILRGKVIKVYDGDTITIACRHKSGGLFSTKIYRFSVRLAKIDCPELKTSDDDEKHVALIAKRELEAKVLGKVVVLKDISVEKYGRILADVYVDRPFGVNSPPKILVNDWMLERRLAVHYDGGTKRKPVSWSNYYYNGSME